MKVSLGWTNIKHGGQHEQTAKDIPWCKSLKILLVFTRKEIDDHRNKSGKRNLKKVLKRGLKFLEERYLSSDTDTDTDTVRLW